MKIENWSCVYLITCKGTGKRYIGATANLKRRINNHPLKLKIENVQVLQHAPRNRLPAIERHWIEKLKPELNVRPRQTGGAGQRRSAATKKRMSKWQSGIKRGPHGHGAKISKALRGVPKSPEHRRKAALARKAVGNKPWSAKRWRLHIARGKMRHKR